MAITKDFIVKNGIQIQGIGSTVATSTGTGALIVSGGAGFDGSVYAKDLFTKDGQVLTTGTIATYGVVAIFAGTDTAVSSNTGTVVVWNTGTLQTVTDRGAISSNVITLTNNTDSTTTGSGALKVVGGVGIGQQLTVGSAAIVGANTANFVQFNGSTATTAVSIFATGTDATVNFDIIPKNNGIVSVRSTAASATTANNALYVAGGLGVAGALYSSGAIYENSVRILTVVTLTSGPGIQVVNNGKSGSQQSYTINNAGVTSAIGTTYLGVNTATGAVTFTNLGVQTLTAGTDTAVSASTGTITVWTTSTLQSITSRGATTNQAISITNTATSNTSTNGALTVAGGVGVGGNLNVAGTMNVAGAATFSGQVTFTGTATYVNSTNTYWTDNILEVHTPPGGPSDKWTVDDGHDIGFRLHYFNRSLSTGTNAALVLANDTQWLEWYSAGAEGTSTFAGSVYGGFKTGIIALADTSTNVGNATSGALQVAGGAGFAKDLWVGGLDATASSTQTSAQAIVVNANGIGVNGNSYFGNDLGIAANLRVGGISTLTGVTYLGGAVTANSSLGVAGNFNVTGTSVLTGAVTANGPFAVNGATYLSYITTVTNTTQANSTITGALQVAGGIGVRGNGYFGGNVVVSGNVNVVGTINATVVGITSTASNLSAGGTGQIPFQTQAGQTSFFGPGTAGDILVSNGAVAGGPAFTNVLTLAGTTDSTSTTSGALQVRGGAGVAKNLVVGGGLAIAGASTVTGVSVHIGAGYFDSNLGVKGNLAVTGTSVLTGAATANGALGVAGNFNVTGTSILTGLVTAANANFTGAVGITGTTTIAGPLLLNNATSATSTTTGALVVKGGAAVQGDLWVGGNIYLDGVGLDTVYGTTATFQKAFITGTGVSLLVSNSMGVGGQITATNLAVTGQSTLSNLTAQITTVTTFKATGDAHVVGNIGVTGNAFITGTSVTIGAAYLDNNLGIKGNLFTTGTSVTIGAAYNDSNLGVKGNLAVTGTSVLTGAVTVGTSLQVVSYASVTTNTNAVMNLDSYPISSYRTAKFVAQIVDTGSTPNKVQVEELLVFHDNNGASTIPYIIQYAIGSNTGELGSWDAVYSSGNIVLQFTPNYTPVSLTVKTARSTIAL